MPVEPARRTWLDAHQAAEELGVSVKTIYRAVQRREIRHARLGGRPGAELRFRIEWLDSWMEGTR
jgi:excisionase family DNA binding protein